MNWLLLIYRIPREPSASRVYVWRKLKQLGAIAIQDAVWVLPTTPRTREQFQWLSAEITELGGDASLFTSQTVLADRRDWLKEQFESPIRNEYKEILAALKRRAPDLPSLSKRFQQLQQRDYFKCPLGDRVRQALLHHGEPIK
jgi:hypothetical protein